MEGRQSKCNYCIHALLRCFHFPSCAFKSECENSTLALLVILELSELSSRAFFSFGKLYFTYGAGDNASYIHFGETKEQYFNRSLRHGTEMRHRNLRSDSVLIHIGFVLVPGFGTQP